MRMIEFRAWDKEKQKYVEPALIDYAGNTYEVSDGQSNGHSCSVVGNANLQIEQFTGLYDKNGKKIYEGTILKWKHTYDFTKETKEYVEPVYWEEKDASYVVGHWFEPLGHLLEEDDVEVIGNIHEDREWLNEVDS